MKIKNLVLIVSFFMLASCSNGINQKNTPNLQSGKWDSINDTSIIKDVKNSIKRKR